MAEVTQALTINVDVSNLVLAPSTMCFTRSSDSVVVRYGADRASVMLIMHLLR